MFHAIQTHSLTRSFGDVCAVDRVTMNVPTGGIYGFLGRNGAGKTTTIKLLLGLLNADSGSVLIAGTDITANRLLAASKIGALLENQGFYPQLSGRQNLDLTRRLLNLPSKEIDRVLEVTQMSEYGHRRVGGYSMGMRQRLGLARAMLGAPPVLLLDEPTNGLDPEGIADIRAFLRELPARTGATVLVSSHLLTEIEQIATHVGIMNRGRLTLEGDLSELKSGLASQLTIKTDSPGRAHSLAIAHGFRTEKEQDAIVAKIDALQDERHVAAQLNSILCGAGIHVHALIPHQRTLESLYHLASSSTAEDEPHEESQ